jgi:hypothetical protein
VNAISPRRSDGGAGGVCSLLGEGGGSLGSRQEIALEPREGR